MECSAETQECILLKFKFIFIKPKNLGSSFQIIFVKLIKLFSIKRAVQNSAKD